MKLENRTGHIQIPLSQLRITSNVRTDFDEREITELAQSIKENGLINAITVKPPVTDEHGDKTYEVIAGGRRIRAHQWLCDNGFDASMIDCKIATGDMWTLQMIENIQRTDLTPRDKENAIAAALEQGLTQKQIADRLSKPIQYVNDIVAGAKVRKIADAAYLNTDGVSTKALAQLRGIPESELTEYLEELCMRGGSVATATALLHEWKAKQAEKELAKETPHGDFTMPAPSTPESSKESDAPRDDFIMQMPDTESEEEAWANEVHRYDTEFAKSMGREIPDDDDESTIEPTMMTEAEFNETEDSDPHLRIRTEPKSKKKPASFNWYINNASRMEAAMLELPTQIKKMPAGTKICVQAGSKIAEISSVIYEPNENRLIFRCLEDFGVY